MMPGAPEQPFGCREPGRSSGLVRQRPEDALSSGCRRRNDLPPKRGSWTATLDKDGTSILEKAPDRIAVLKQLIRQFIRQFSPMSWSRSRAAIVAANTKLLDELEAYPDTAVAKFVMEEKVRLSQCIEQEKRQETELDRARDERFE
jgi:hypothetical protein